MLARQKQWVTDDAKGLPVMLSHLFTDCFVSPFFHCYRKVGADVAANSNNTHCPGNRLKNTMCMEVNLSQGTSVLNPGQKELFSF